MIKLSTRNKQIHYNLWNTCHLYHWCPFYTLLLKIYTLSAINNFPIQNQFGLSRRKLSYSSDLMLLPSIMYFYSKITEKKKCFGNVLFESETYPGWFKHIFKPASSYAIPLWYWSDLLNWLGYNLHFCSLFRRYYLS